MCYTVHKYPEIVMDRRAYRDQAYKGGDTVTEQERARRRILLSRAKRRKQLRQHLILGFVALAAIFLFVFGVWHYAKSKTKSAANDANADQVTSKLYIADRPELDVQLLPVNKYSRPGTALETVKGIVVHYTGNPGTTAQQNRDYFAGLAETGETSASSHFVVGLSGEIVQCIPCNEISYASNNRNKDTISIECCIEDDTGKFNEQTYQSLVKLVTWLMGRYDLETDDVIRHYDVTGKQCPKYFVEHPKAWKQFKKDLVDYIAKYGIAKEE